MYQLTCVPLPPPSSEEKPQLGSAAMASVPTTVSR
jgi:hypothetical protein